MLSLALAAGIVSIGASITGSIDIAPVWAGHSVGFCLLTHNDHQFVAFYDSERRMTVAHRKLDSREWALTRLPQQLGWDSHNSVTMAIDDGGFIHLSGNMHCVPLIYFRTTKPLDPATFERVPNMVGDQEARCTYPVFLRGAAGEFLFTYRTGGSGNGDQIYNIYDEKTKTWRRLLDKPLTNGEGERNAYFVGPRRGPDGYFHLCWVWRESGDCATNHDLSYARSRDLVHWENSRGLPVELPITLATGEVVDPVPVGGGIINGNTRIGFDSLGRVILSYHKFDEQGKTQAYSARLESGAWKIYRTSDWDYRWDFRGGGSIVFEIRIGSVENGADRRLRQSFTHPSGSGAWVLDEATLRPVSLKPSRKPLPLERLESTYEGMKVATCGDSGKSPLPGTRYVLKWETLGTNRDRPRDAAPPPSMLRLYAVKDRQ